MPDHDLTSADEARMLHNTYDVTRARAHLAIERRAAREAGRLPRLVAPAPRSAGLSPRRSRRRLPPTAHLST
jgi:hypothetical protein